MAAVQVKFELNAWLRWAGLFLLSPVAALLAMTVAGSAPSVATALLGGAMAAVLIAAGMCLVLDLPIRSRGNALTSGRPKSVISAAVVKDRVLWDHLPGVAPARASDPRYPDLRAT
jgi:hypothetical protein